MSRWLFFPLLIAIHPVLSAFAGPGKWQPLEDFYRPAIVSLVIVLVLWGFLSGATRSFARAAYAVSAFWFLLFAYGAIDQYLVPLPYWASMPIIIVPIVVAVAGASKIRNGRINWLVTLTAAVVLSAASYLTRPLAPDLTILASLWLILTIAFATWAGRIRDVERLIPYLNVLAVGLLAIPLYTAFNMSREAMSYANTAQVPDLSIGTKHVTTHPDIYQFVLDGYGRADALDRGFAFNNKPFLQALKSRGFVVESHSRSNYAQTEQALASELNGEYLSKLLPSVDQNSRNRSLLTGLIRDNAVARAIQAQGYDYVTISSGFPQFNRDSARKDLSDPVKLSLAEQVLLYQTPESGLRLSSRYLHQEHRDLVNHAFDAAATLPASGTPKYVLVHVLAPHPPFVFDRNGGPVEPPHLFGIWDADLYVNVIASKAEYTTGYPEQLQYVNQRIIHTIDQILASSKTPPVIILQGDHGPRRDHSMATIDHTDASQSYENLVAILAPQSVRKNLRDDMSSVNIMRAVISGLFGSKFEKLPDQSLYSTWEHPYSYIDVTKRVR